MPISTVLGFLGLGKVKTEFFEKLWNVWSWSDIAERFDTVQRTEVGLTGATDTSKGGAHG